MRRTKMLVLLMQVMHTHYAIQVFCIGKSTLSS